ncbi:MAG: hypothetical protein K5694_03405 [Bacilli bacterium]|nr:hypothetical protein [Bacilli bacterium]
MNKNGFFSKSILLLSVAFLSSCAQKGSNIVFTYKPGVDLEKSAASSLVYHDFFYQSQGHRMDSLPSKGDFNVVVIPVNFNDYKFDDSSLMDLDAAFNSKKPKYYESLTSFYEKSSFGNVSFNATILDPYETNQTVYEFVNSTTSRNQIGTRLLRTAITKYKEAEVDFKPFDQDENGLIDAVYLVYAAPDYLSEEFSKYSLSDEAKSILWAFVSWDNTIGANKNSPNACSFVWASKDFMYKGVKKGEGVDSHTFIHETGHLFGLADYYNYSRDNKSYTDNNYKFTDPVGGLDMMDCNILDHNMWSKYALGWVEPYLITKDMSFPLDVEINSANEGDLLIIPSYYDEPNGTAFDEFMMVELYSPSGLNAVDSSSSHYLSYPRGYYIPGVKISHVDSRMAHYTSSANYEFGVDVTNKEFLKLSTGQNSFFRIAASNTSRSSLYPETYKPGANLIHLMEANGKFTFRNENYANEESPYYQKMFYANNGTLFQAEEDRYLFNMEKFKDFFVEHDEKGKALFNNGKEFGYAIKINGIKQTENGYKCSLTIERD